MGEIKKQGINNSIISFSGIILGSLSILYIQPKLLLASEIGLLNVMFSFAQILGVILPLGVGNIAIRYFPEIPDRYNGSKGLLGLLFLSTLIGLIIIGGLLLAFKPAILLLYSKNSPEVGNYYPLLIGFAFVISLISVMTVYSAIHFKTIFPSLLNDLYVRFSIIILVVIYALGWFSANLLPYFYVSIFFTQALLLFFFIKSYDKIKLIPDWKFFKSLAIGKMLKYGILMMFTSIASIGIKFINNLILAIYLPLETVGVYALAVFMSALMEAPATALEKIAFPKVAQAMSNNNLAEVKKIYFDSSKYLLLAGCFLFAMIYVNIDFFYFLIPEIYGEGKNAVLLLCVASLFNLATGVNNSIIFNSRKYYWGSIFLYILIVLAVINNLLLIPIWGLTGAALAMAISIFVYNLLKYIYIWWHWKMQPLNKTSVISIIILGACIYIDPWIPNGSNAIYSIMIHSIVIGVFFIISTIATGIVKEFYEPYLKGKR